jgi:hypothetical protein
VQPLFDAVTAAYHAALVDAIVAATNASRA